MNKNIIRLAKSLTTILQNVHLNISLSGWPAATTAIVGFGSVVTIYALNVTHPQNKPQENSTN